MNMNLAEIKHVFTYHAPTDEQTRKYMALRREALILAEEINALCPNSREKSLAITKLREAIMWANASIACHEE